MSETKECKPVTISIDFNLPNHTTELKQAAGKIAAIRKKFNIIKHEETIDNEIHTTLYEEVVSTLDWVGRMSKHLFELRNELEESYEIAYVKAPKLGYELFDQHYGKLHHPYTTLKNRCFTLLEDLDNTYIEKFKKTPPNWNI